MSLSVTSNSNHAPPQENLHRASLVSSLHRLLTGILGFFSLLCSLTRRALNFFTRNPKPCSIIALSPAADQSASLFCSLPNDVVLNCLARVPRRYYPNLTCVSKCLRSLVHSPELAHMRALMGKNNPVFYVCFWESALCFDDGRHHWFTLNPNEKKTCDLNSVDQDQVLSREIVLCSSVSIGHKIYFVGGSMCDKSRDLWIFDSWSGKLCKGPKMKVSRVKPGVAVVDEKLYVMGGCREGQIKVEVFDPKTQTWKVGPLSRHGNIRYGEGRYGEFVTEAVALDGKVYGMSYTEGSHIIYNTKDGRCETFKMEIEDAYWRRGGVCVINNVIYVYYFNLGLMWFDSIDKVWRMVKGLNMLDREIEMVGMVEFNGKLGFMWASLKGFVRGQTKFKKIWFAMIVLDRSGVEIHGTVEWSKQVGSVPHCYDIWRCLGVSY
ncbi:hypothetical protein CARUB_v10025263mg [Capsella rubella]|uniref:F-box domain-containing protein n=1 Tax=Capsella rubella TaxID=81985 RepID=R0HUF1_9BRAS|nr:F-box/kelch-repeat protein At2g22030 [Capsella rubella]EOA29010.1 hypothetical protein CARUB_v10025263mg [Capsella rubella]